MYADFGSINIFQDFFYFYAFKYILGTHVVIYTHAYSYLFLNTDFPSKYNLIFNRKLSFR